MPMRRLKFSGELALSLGIVALGLFLVVQTAGIDVSPSYARVGPRVFPWVISFGLILLGLLLARDAIAGQWIADDSTPGAPAFDWHAFLLIGLGLILHMVLIGRGGFVIASTVLFVCVARGFGSRAWLRDTVIGAILAFVVYVGFKYGLGLDLPAGVLAGIL
jgi:putative tricarboxylic transport membrane protein